MNISKLHKDQVKLISQKIANGTVQDGMIDARMRTHQPYAAVPRIRARTVYRRGTVPYTGGRDSGGRAGKTGLSGQAS